MTNSTPLTADELRALAYFAVGVTSEGSLGGRDVSYRLSFAGNVRADGRMVPVGTSGYSFGTLQVDLGQHPDVAPRLLDAYQQWAGGQPDRVALSMGPQPYADTLAALRRTGHQMEDANAVDIDRSRINRFLASDAGLTFVHELDAEHVNGVTAVDSVIGNRDSALERLQRTTLYRDASDEDQARLAGMMMKLQNQSGTRRTPGLLGDIERGELASAAEVKTAIDRLMRNTNGRADYLESGADNTLRGVDVFNALRATSSENPIHAAWSSVVANPLIGPVEAHAPNTTNPQLGLQYDAVRSLFLTPEGSQRMVQALENGTTLAEGNPNPTNGRRGAGFYVSGHDFVHWNANGQGVASIGGQWRSVDPAHLQRVANRNGTFDLQLTEGGRTTTLLHVDPNARTNRVGADVPVRDMPTQTSATPDAGRRSALANDPSHRDFATFNRIHEWVRGTGQWNDEQSRNVSAALYREQASDTLMVRVDSVRGGLGRDGAQNVFAVYEPYGPAGPVFHARVDGREAVQQPAQRNLEIAEQAAIAQTQAPPAHSQSIGVGPRLAV